MNSFLQIQPHVLPSFCSPVRRILNFGDVIEKDRSRSSAEKISDTLKTGKCSPIIPPVVEDQEISSFEPVTSSTNGNCAPDVMDTKLLESGGRDTVLNGITTKKEELPIIMDELKSDVCNEPSIRDLTQEINAESEKSCSGSVVVNDILVSNVGENRFCSAEVLLSNDSVSEALPPGMTSQACQTDPELEDIVVDPFSNPTMVDKGVGTSGLTLMKAIAPSRPLSSFAGRTSTVHTTASITNRTPASVPSSSTFAGITTKCPSASIARSSTCNASKNVNSSLKSTLATINHSSKPTCTNGPVGSSTHVSAFAIKGHPNVGTAVPGNPGTRAFVPLTSATSSTPASTAPKASLAGVVTKPSTASVVKRNAAKAASLV